MIPVYEIVFYFFAAMLLLSSLAVILLRNSVRSALALVVAFFATSVLWLLVQAEFLSLVLIFVYVGAVMTLFLFVVMMLNIDASTTREKFVRYLPAALIVMVVFVSLLCVTYLPKNLPGMALHQVASLPAGMSNTELLGINLYTKHLLDFEIAGVILFVAIVASISLAFFGRRPNVKSQEIAKQHAVTKASRLRIVKMQAEKK